MHTRSTAIARATRIRAAQYVCVFDVCVHFRTFFSSNMFVSFPLEYNSTSMLFLCPVAGLRLASTDISISTQTQANTQPHTRTQTNTQL